MDPAPPPPPAVVAQRTWAWVEVWWALGLGFCVAGITALPYLWGQTSAPYGWHYLGFVYNPDDVNVHLSWIRQAAEGATFFRNEFTSEPHTGRFFSLFMLGLGRLAALLHIGPYAVWAAARVVWAVLLVLALWAVTVPLTQRPRVRRLAVLTVVLSSGLGWLSVALGWSLDPVDLEPDRVMPEAITFLSLYLNPLFSSSMALLLGAMALGGAALRRLRWDWAVAAGLLGVLLANQHTYDVIPLALTLLAWTLDLSRRDGWPRARWGVLGVIALLCLPAVYYQYQLIQNDALYAAKANTITATPSLPTMLVSYGLILPLAAIGGWRMVRRDRWLGRLLVWWAMLQWVCIYLPTSLFPFQRKMIEGLHIPLALLAGLGLAWLARTLPRWLAARRLPAEAEATSGPEARRAVVARARRWVVPLATVGLLTLVPSNLLFVLSTFDNLSGNNESKAAVLMPPFSLPDPDLAALDWLPAHSADDAVVLCLPYVGNYVPGRIGRTVFVGHWAETINYVEKLGQYRAFINPAGDPAEKTAWLRDMGIDYVFVGTYEQIFARDQWPMLPALDLVCPPNSPHAPVRIYRVRPTIDPAEEA